MFRLRSRVTLALVLAAALSLTGVQGAQAATSQQNDVASLVNQQRSSAGLGGLVHDDRLDAIAQEWAQQMSNMKSMVHSTNQWRSDRLPTGWRANGENIAYGYGSASAVMSAWMQSPGHKANILNSAYTSIGVGYVASGNYWVQLFAAYPGTVVSNPAAVSNSAAQTAIESVWTAAGGVSGSLGRPTSGLLQVSANGGGVGQAFQGGSIYWTKPAGAFSVTGGVRDFYFSQRGESGPLGWPVAAMSCGSDGSCQQAFQGGTVYWSKTLGGRIGLPAIESVWTAAGGVSGSLGKPTSGLLQVSANGGGVGQAFQGGSIYWTKPAGAFSVTGGVRDFYFSQRGESGPLGWPVAAMSCGSDGSCQQAFQGGTVYWSKTLGGRIGLPAIESVWTAAGGVSGSLGRPTSGLLQVSANGGGVGQAFQGGSIYWTKPAGAFSVTGGVRDFYFSQRGESGPLGWPVAAMSCGSDGSCQQAFQGGTVYWSKTLGGRIGLPAIESVWTAAGGVSGSLGRPTSGLLQVSANGGGVGQAFQGGSIYWTKPAGAFSVTGGVRDFYFSQRGESGPLGWPVAAMSCGSDGSCQQAFQGGTVYWSKTLGGRIG